MKCEFPDCPRESMEFFEVRDDDDGVNLCMVHYDAALDEILARQAEGPTLTSKVKTPVHDWLEIRPYPFPG